MHEEEESMEMSGGERQLSAGEASLTSMLHNFSFDVSWNTWNKQPSPPRRRSMAVISPARLAPPPPNPLSCSTPTPAPRVVSHHHFNQPTVKVGQHSNLLQSLPRTGSMGRMTDPMLAGHVNRSQSEVNFPVAPKPQPPTVMSEINYSCNPREISSPRRHSEMNYKQFEMDLIRGGSKPYYDYIASPSRHQETSGMQYNDSFHDNEMQENRSINQGCDFRSLMLDEGRRRSTPSRLGRDQDRNHTDAHSQLDSNMNVSPKKLRNINNNEVDNFNNGPILESPSDGGESEYQNVQTRRRSSAKTLKKKRVVSASQTKGKVEKASAVTNSSRWVLCLVMLSAIGMGAYLYIQADSCSVFNIDMDTLRARLAENVFGQHIAVASVISSLHEFSSSIETGNNRNTLVLSFHGWTGVGKNYISRFVAECFYNAKIFWYLIPLHFPRDDQLSQSTDIQTWIHNNVTTCGVNVFVFDEMDKSGEHLLAGLVSAIQTLQLGWSDDNGQKLKSPIAVFIFLSNSKASHINQYLFSQIQVSKPRESLELSEFEYIFQNSAGEWYEEIMSQGIIDKFIPFLPLAEAHVRQCVRRDIIQRGRHPSGDLIDLVMEELSFFDMGGRDGQMSLTGCKRVQDKVDLHVEN